MMPRLGPAPWLAVLSLIGPFRARNPDVHVRARKPLRRRKRKASIDASEAAGALSSVLRRPYRQQVSGVSSPRDRALCRAR